MPSKNNKQHRMKWKVIEDCPKMNPLLVVGYLAETDFRDDKGAHIRKCRRAAARFGASWQDVVGPSRLREFVTIRHMCFKFLRSEGWTLREIGEAFNNRDHATALHGVNTADDLLDTDRDFRRKWLTFLQS